MATIQKRGQSYSIRVSSGYDISGKQIIHSKTWTPKPGLSERQIKKELERQVVPASRITRSVGFGNMSVYI